MHPTNSNSNTPTDPEISPDIVKKKCYRISGNFGAMEILAIWRMTKIRQIKERQFFQLQNP